METESLKISVVTPVYNGEAMIGTCMESVSMQTYPNKEHVIVDGLSTDDTVAMVNKNRGNHTKLLSEKDNGLYDAFNKGIGLSQGDIICFLCADDMYAHNNVLQSVADAFRSNKDADMIYGDIVYVDRDDLSKVVRYWKSSTFKKGLFRQGWMAPNTALFIRREVFNRCGLYQIEYRMAADYELQYRLFEMHQFKSVYLPGVMVRMRSGGVSNSSIGNVYKSLSECYAALRRHRVPLSWLNIMNTVFYRLRQTRIPAEIRRLNDRQVQYMIRTEIHQ